MPLRTFVGRASTIAACGWPMLSTETSASSLTARLPTSGNSRVRRKTMRLTLSKPCMPMQPMTPASSCARTANPSHGDSKSKKRSMAGATWRGCLLTQSVQCVRCVDCPRCLSACDNTSGIRWSKRHTVTHGGRDKGGDISRLFVSQRPSSNRLTGLTPGLSCWEQWERRRSGRCSQSAPGLALGLVGEKAGTLEGLPHACLASRAISSTLGARVQSPLQPRVRDRVRSGLRVECRVSDHRTPQHRARRSRYRL